MAKTVAYLMGTALVAAMASPALAVPTGPTAIGDGVTLDPMLDARIRYEHVDQPTLDGDAVTIRVRPGVELAFKDGLSLLVEGEATLAVIDNYDAFPFAIVSSQDRPGHSVIADPNNIELNRAQLQYKKGKNILTLGRQRINLDDQRWVGAVGWRQNEQTFDAARLQLNPIGPLMVDVTYALSQRTIFGGDAGIRTAYDGDFLIASMGAKFGPVDVKGFAYLLDFDAGEPVASTKTLGVLASGKVPLAKGFDVSFKASYATQSDYGSNPADFSVDYLAGELGGTYKGFGLLAGYEQLGADGLGNRVQTPMATLHKFNGTADLFLSTPAAGLQDIYGTASYVIGNLGALKGIAASVTYHQYDSDVGNVDFGSEWDAQLGFKLSDIAVLLKYANYKADGFGADTEKFWFELGYSF